MGNAWCGCGLGWSGCSGFTGLPVVDNHFQLRITDHDLGVLEVGDVTIDRYHLGFECAGDGADFREII